MKKQWKRWVPMILMACMMVLLYVPAHAEECKHRWCLDQERHQCDLCTIQGYHEWQAGKCTICGYECLHSITPAGVCDFCGIPCPHKWKQVDEYTEMCDWCYTDRQIGSGDDDPSDPCEYGHDFKNGFCSDCGEPCPHDWNPYTGWCFDCGMACKHEDDDGSTAVSDGVCKICDKEVEDPEDANDDEDYECTHDDWNPVTGRCYGCGLPCTHTWAQTGKCSICGMACSHDWNPNTGKCNTCEMPCNGKCGDSVYYVLTGSDTNGYTLTIFGNGAIADYTAASPAPWNSKKSSITRVVIDGNVTAIGDYAFKGCTALTRVELPEDNELESIGENAFESTVKIYCAGLSETFTAQLGAGRVIVLEGSCGNSVHFELAADGKLTISGTGAMADYTANDTVAPWDDIKESIQTVVVGNGVTTIGNYAFNGCQALTSVSVPASVTSIGAYAFKDAGSGNPNSQSIISMAFEEGSQLTTLGEGVFYNANIQSIDLPAGVKTIGKQAFQMSYLETITFPDGLTTIGESAFESCTGIDSVTIPDSVSAIGSKAFYGTIMQNVTVPISAVLGADAFPSYCEITYAGSCGENVTCTLSPDGTLTISGTGAMTDYSVGECPWFDYRRSIKSIVIESGVTSIGDYVFHGCQNEALKSVIIPDGVTRIGKNAFLACSNLPVITVPDSVTEIGESAFDSCSALASVNIPDGVKIISQKAFYNCASLTSVNIPDGVTSIGEEAFSGCNELASVILPDGVTSIGTGAFSDCPSLTEITIPAGVTEIGSDPFWGCTNLTRIILQGGKDQYDQVGSSLPENIDIVIAAGSCGNGVTYELTTAGKLTISGTGAMTDHADEFSVPWYSEKSNIKNVVIPDGVTSIGSYAFSGCSDLTSITLPAGVTSIGSYAFSGCTDLSSVALPADVTSIGDGAFDDTTSLSCTDPSDGLAKCAYANRILVKEGSCGTSVNFVLMADGTLTISGSGAMTDWSSNAATPWAGKNVVNVVIEEGVTSIGKYAFHGMASVVSTTLPSSLTAINERAFQYSGLGGDIVIPAGVTSIGRYAISGCSITSYTFAEGSAYTAVSRGTFRGCANLTSVVLPPSVTSITENNIIESSSNLHTLIFTSASAPSINASAFTNAADPLNVYYPSTWTNFDTTKTYGSTGTVNWYPVNSKGVKALTDTISYFFTDDGKTLNIVGTGAMPDCSAYDEVPPYGRMYYTKAVIGEGITYVGAYAFCITDIRSVSLPSTLKKIGFGAFARCIYLNDVTLPDEVTVLGQQAFAGCTNLTKFTISPNSKLETLDYAAMSYYVTSVYLPETLKTIGGGNFYGSNLSSVTYAGSRTQWSKISISSNSNGSLQEAANFTYEKVSLIYDLNGGSCKEETVINVTPGTTAQVNLTPTREDYEFLGWKRGDEDVEPGSNITLTEDVTLTAQWQIISYTLKMEVGSDAEVPNYEVKDGAVEATFDIHTPVTLPTPTREGYLFRGWTLDGESVTSVTMDENITVTARWAARLNDTVGWEIIGDTLIISGTGDMPDYVYGGTKPAFAQSSYTKLVIEEGITSAGNWAFQQASITSVSLPTTLKKIGDYAFFDCNQLNNVTIPDQVTVIGEHAFAECKKLSQLTIVSASKLETLGDFALHNTAIASIYLPETMKAIGSWNFSNTEVLTGVTYGGSRTQWSAISITGADTGAACNKALLQEGIITFLKCTLTYDLNGGTWGWETVIHAARGTQITLDVKPERERRSFNRWTLNGETVETVTLTDDITITAEWCLQQAALTLHLGDDVKLAVGQSGYSIKDNCITIICTPGLNKQLPVVTKDKVYYEGWQINGVGDVLTSIKPEDDMDLYPVFLPARNVYLHLSPDYLTTEKLNSLSFAYTLYNEYIKLEVPPHTAFNLLDITGPHGTALQGWKIDNKGEVLKSVTVEAEQYHLYPVWQPHVTITLDLHYGYPSAEWFEQYAHETYTESGYCDVYGASDSIVTLPVLPDHEDGRFLGWQNDGEGEIFTTYKLSASEDEVWLYPCWEQPVPLFFKESAYLSQDMMRDMYGNAVQYYEGEGYQVNRAPNTTVTLPSLKADEYNFEFVGWQVYRYGEKVGEPTLSLYATESCHLEPVWAGDTGYCSVTLILNGNEMDNTWLDQYNHPSQIISGTYEFKIKAGTTITLPQIAAPTGKTILGWVDLTVPGVINGYTCLHLVESLTISEGTQYSFGVQSYQTGAALKLPKALSVIKAEAFAGVNAQIVFVPAGCTSIESGAFADCSNLKYVVFETGNPSFDEGAFPEGVLLILSTTTIDPGLY